MLDFFCICNSFNILNVQFSAYRIIENNYLIWKAEVKVFYKLNSFYCILSVFLNKRCFRGNKSLPRGGCSSTEAVAKSEPVVMY